jgi:antirestriction protein ArdC
MREDNRSIVRAASQASKVADYLLGFLAEAIVDMKTERMEQEVVCASSRQPRVRE